MKYLYVALVLLIGFQMTSWGQLPSIVPGTQIRITLTPNTPFPIEGTVQKITPDTLFATIGPRTIPFSIQNIQKIEIFHHYQHHTIAGAIIGALSGAVILGTFFYNQERQARKFEKVGQPGGTSGAIVGILLGGIIGGNIGHSIRTARWQQVYPLPSPSTNK